MPGSSRGRLSQPRVLAGMLVAALLVLGSWGIAPARAQTPTPLPGTTFQGADGDQATAPLLTDWQDLYAQGRVIVQNDPNANDNVLIGQELDPNNWRLGSVAGGATPSKANVLAAWYATEFLPGGNFLYFAFRRQDPNGDTYLAFVVNQSTATWVNATGTTIPCRLTGDILISYWAGTNSSSVGLARWTSTSNDPVSGCSRLGFYTDVPLAGTNAQGALNVGFPVTNFMTPGEATFPSGEFGEGALNLSSTLGYSCDRYRQVQVHSRSSSSIDSALSDTADPVTIDLGGCEPRIAVTGPPRIHHGETATFQYTVTNTANNGLSNITVSDNRCPSGNMTGPVKSVGDQDAILTRGEVWLYECSYVVTDTHAAGETDPIVSTATVSGTFGTSTASDMTSHTMDVLHPAIAIDQEVRRGASGAYLQGPIEAHSGDTAFYRFTVTNPGDAPLAVSPDFPACNGGTMTGPTGDADVDGLLDPGETWIYLCRHALTTADADPFSSASTVTGTDALGRAVTATDSTLVDLLNPAIEVTGGVRRSPADPYSDGTIDARVGDTLEYRYLVTNPGDAPLSVVATDPRCDAGTLSAPSGDTDGDNRLDTTETWAYTCTHLVVSSDADPLDNRLTATGTDALGLSRTASSTETVDLLYPGIAVDKELRLGATGAYVQGPIEVHRGDEIYYRFTVTNTGDAPMSVSVSDPRCDTGTLSGPVGDVDADNRLALTETWTYTCRRVVAASDPDPLPNRVDVTGTDVLGTAVTDFDTASADILTPGVAVDKTIRRGTTGAYLQGPIQAHADDTLYYRFAVTNTSDSPLAVTLTDPRCEAGTLTAPAGDADVDDRLDVTETWVYTCRRTITSADADPFVNQVTVVGRDNLGGESTAIDTAIADVLHPEVAVDSEVRVGAVAPYSDATAPGHLGDTAEYRFTVTNPGDTELSVSVTALRCDSGTLSAPLGDTDADGWLDTTETWTYTCSHLLTAADADPFTARVNVAASDALGGPAAATDMSTVDLLHPAIAVDTTVRRAAGDPYTDGPVDALRGETLQYRFAVTNAGDTPLDVALSAAQCDAGTLGAAAGDANGDGLLGLAETWTYTCTRTVRATDPDPLPVTGTATGTDLLGGTAVASDTANADLLHAGVSVDALVRRGAADPFVQGPVDTHVDDTLHYRFDVTNTGDTPVMLDLQDTRCDAGTISPPAGDSDDDGWLDLTETWTYTCRDLVTATDPDPVVNTVTVTGTDSLGGSDEASDVARADVLHPQVALDKRVRRGATGAYVPGPVDARLGDVLGYEFTVTNPGDTPLQITLDDPLCDAGTMTSFSGDGDADGALDTSETWTATCTHALVATDPDPFTNVADVTGTDVLGGEDQASDSASANVLAAGISVDAAARRGTGAFSDGPIDAHVGDEVEYRFVVTNLGETALAVAMATTHCDAGTLGAPAGDTDGDDRLDRDETWTYLCTRVVLATDSDPFSNVVTATGTDALDGSDSDTDAVGVDVLHPQVAVDHEIRRGTSGAFAQGPVDAHRGDTLTHRFTVTNTGDTPLTVAVDAARCDIGTLGAPAGDADGDGRLDLAETWTYTCTDVVAATDADPLPSTGTVTGTDGLGAEVTATDGAAADLLDPAVAVDGSIRRGDAGAFSQEPIDVRIGDEITYRFSVTNTGDTPLAIAVDEPVCDAATLSGPAGDTDADARLDLDETWVYTCTHAVTADDPDPLLTATTVTGTDVLGRDVTGSDATRADVRAPAVDVTSRQRRQGSGAFTGNQVNAHTGDVVLYEFTLANTGDTPVVPDPVNDGCDAGTLAHSAGDTDADGRLDLAEVWTYTCSHEVLESDPDPVVNRMTITGTDALGASASDEDSVEAEILKPAIGVVEEISADGSNWTRSTVEVDVGHTLHYRFMVTNAGDADLAAGITATRCDAGTVTRVGGDADPRLDPDETWTYRCRHVATADDPEDFESPVTATGRDVLDGVVEANDNGRARLRPVADLELTKTGPAKVMAGGDIAFTLVVTNHGPSPAKSTVVRDTLPQGLTFKSAHPGQGECTDSSGTLICTLGRINSGASTSILVVAGTSAQEGGLSVTNTASVASTETDPNPANNRDSATVDIELPTQPLGSVDLVVDKSLLNADDAVGDELTYLITVVNDSAAVAHDVNIHDTLSDAVRLVSATPSRGVCSGAPALRCSVGDIAPGETVTVRIVVVPLREGSLTNRATASAVETDPNPANNTSSVSRTIRPRATTHRLSKSGDRRSAKPGEVVTFTLTYRNRGRSAAHRVRVCDKLPRELSFVAAPGARYRNGSACWSRSKVARGRTLQFKVRVRVNSTRATRTVNVATARASNAAAVRATAGLRIERRAPRVGGVTG